MAVFTGVLGFLLSVFLFLAFLAGAYMQLGGNFYTGTGVVVLCLLIEIMREVSRNEKRKKLGWISIIMLSLGTIISFAGLLLTLIIALVTGWRSFYILLLDAALSTIAFLSSSFIRCWRRWK
jgi:MFS family permease